MTRPALLVGLLCLTLGCGSGSSSPGRAAFDAADREIAVNKSKDTPHGNGPEAIKMADHFAYLLKAVRTVAFTKGGASGVSGGYFLTYCHVTDNGVAFLVHVPELRKFTEDAQAALLQLAWSAAVETTKRLPNASSLQLAVGLRGALIYGGIATGKAASEAPAARNTSTPDVAALYPFFEGTYPSNLVASVPNAQDDSSESAGREADDEPEVFVERISALDTMSPHLAVVQGATTVTAFAVTPDLFAAADPGGQQPFRLTMTDGRSVDVAVASHDRRSQLVLLRPVTPFKADPVTLNADPSVSTNATAHGYAAQLDGSSVFGTRSIGVVYEVSLGAEGVLVVKTSARVPAGGLGGPLMEANGRVVGIAMQMGAERQYISAAHIQRSVKTLAENAAYVASLNLPR